MSPKDIFVIDEEGHTSKLTLTLTDRLIKRVKDEAKRRFGVRKGSISMYVEMLLRNDLHLVQAGVEEQ